MAAFQRRAVSTLSMSAQESTSGQSVAGLRVGLAEVGLETYWSQFDGLEERLSGYLGVVEDKVAQGARTVINLGLIDSPQKAQVARHECRQGARHRVIDLLRDRGGAMGGGASGPGPLPHRARKQLSLFQ